LWFDVMEALIHKGAVSPLVLSPFSFYRGLHQKALDNQTYTAPMQKAQAAVSAACEMLHKAQETISLPQSDKALRAQLDQTSEGETYAFCFSCQNCSTVCPVVENYENPQAVLGLLPHQIMRAVGLGLKDLSIGSKMLWDCLTCYQCQEHCPQKVKVTDVLYELKNMAFKETQISAKGLQTGFGKVS